jgi:hypothetical protein
MNKKWFPPVSGIRDICREREKKKHKQKVNFLTFYNIDVFLMKAEK